MKKRILILAGFFIITTLACGLSNPSQHTVIAPTIIPTLSPPPSPTDTLAVVDEKRIFEHEKFSFTIPSNWKTQEEVWGKPMPADADYYGLGLIELITIQTPPGKGEGKAFFSVSSSPLAGGVDLEGRFNMAYENPMPEIKEASRQAFERNGLSGFEITYDRPWGEPWWRFHDIWLEKDAVIYMLSFHASPYSFDNYTDQFDKILDSFKFKE
jgi:hypothetical protein